MSDRQSPEPRVDLSMILTRSSDDSCTLITTDEVSAMADKIGTAVQYCSQRCWQHQCFRFQVVWD